ncbi:hypothetical protein HYU21_02765 [Candidatus Woesearchaeota archaeon]|nr:hypothetical protein [Candidatus Woesearchaeota archaeon]
MVLETSTGGCTSLDSNAYAGFEFYFKDIWNWSTSQGEASETTEAYVCNSGSWKKAPISISGNKQQACKESGGGMIAIKKSDLENYPELYDAGGDIRVYVATAGAVNNISNPSDTANVGWATPGTVDFDIDNLDIFKHKVNASEKFGEGANKGYVEYADVDCWTQTGCADYKCAGQEYCVANGYGVEAAGFTDSRVPKIVGVMKELYPDAALITYFTDKPTNGTLELFGPGDTTCSQYDSANFYGHFPDSGVVSPNVRDYKLWHVAEIAEGAPYGYVNNTNKTYPASLASGSTYYYKIRYCDNESKCGVTKCASFKTEASANDCTFCNFV